MTTSPDGAFTADIGHAHSGNMSSAQQLIASVIVDDLETSFRKCCELGIAWSLNLGAGNLISHVPLMDVLADKAILYKMLIRVRKRLVTNAAAIVLPTTFAMPREYEALQVAADADPNLRWVQRPKASTRGAGTMLLAHASEAERREQWIVQEFVEPIRRDGRPLTFRLHIVLASVEPLAAYVLDQEVAELERYIASITNDPDAMARAAIRLATLAVVGAREPALRRTAVRMGHTQACAQLLGVDFVIAADLRPRLIEFDLDPIGAPDVVPGLAERLLSGLLQVHACEDGLPSQVGDLRRVFPSAEHLDLWPCLALPRPADVALAARDGLAVNARDSLRPLTGVRTWPLDADLAIYTPTGGKLVTTNPIGAFIWRGLADNFDIDRTADELVAHLRLSAERASSEVWAVLGDWVDQDVLVPASAREHSSADGDRWTPTRLSVPYLRWNVDRVYSYLGYSISVRGLPSGSDELLDRVLSAMTDRAPATIDAFIEVARSAQGWRITGTHIAPRFCPTDAQLVPLARFTVLTSLARIVPGAVLNGTAIVHGHGALIIVGPINDRSGLLAAWLATGERWLADDMVVLTADGSAVRPAAIGLMQHITPVKPASSTRELSSLIDPDGRIVRFEVPSVAGRLDHRPFIVRALVILTENCDPDTLTPLSRRSALEVTCASRLTPNDPITESEAETVVNFVSRVPCYRVCTVNPEQTSHLLRKALPAT